MIKLVPLYEWWALSYGRCAPTSGATPRARDERELVQELRIRKREMIVRKPSRGRAHTYSRIVQALRGLGFEVRVGVRLRA